MKTFSEIVGQTTYRQLTTSQKEEIQGRQNYLVAQYQDSTDEYEKEDLFAELYESLKGLIKGMSFRQAEKSFSVEQEDFEGIMNLCLAELLITFDRTLNKPFQPVFLTNVRNEVLMMYRAKGYDLHDTSGSLDDPMGETSQTLVDVTPIVKDLVSDVDTNTVTDAILTELFGNDDKKKTIVHMYVSKFKRNEIVVAVQEDGQSTDATAKMVNRTWSEFKAHYLKAMQQK